MTNPGYIKYQIDKDNEKIKYLNLHKLPDYELMAVAGQICKQLDDQGAELVVRFRGDTQELELPLEKDDIYKLLRMHLGIKRG